jgi:CheY-like chemotaxis protein
MNSHVSRPTLLVADADADLRQSVAGFMSARGYHVEHTNSGLEAAEVLISRKVDVLVADFAVPDKGALELLALAKQSAPSTRSIAVGRAPTSKEREGALHLGAVRVLAKPVALLDLADAVAVASDCSEGFQGWLHRLSLVDVLQMFHLSGQTVTLTLRGAREGRIHVRSGQIVHAELDDRIGEPALVEMLRMRGGSLESSPLDELGTSISGSFEQVLLNGIRQLDEEKRRSTPPRARAPSRDSWAFDLREPSECQLLARWLETHTPGSSAWLVEGGVATEINGEHGSPAERIEVSEVAALLELAERADPTFRRLETAVAKRCVAYLRRGERTLVFARSGVGDEARRRFRFEVTQLSRWWDSEVEHA